MGSHEFYVTLPSDSSFKYHPNNKPCSFKTKLHTALQLKGQWEVSLVEISLTHTFYNVVKGKNEIFLSEVSREPVQTLRVTEGYYKDSEELLREITKNIAKCSKNKEITVKERAFSRRCRIDVPRGSVLILNKELLNILGFQNKSLDFNENTDGKHTIDVNRGMHVFYVYTDIIQAVPVGHDDVQLLRTVDIPHGDVGEVITRTYPVPHYVPLRSNNIDEIEINISKGSGDLVYFNGGLVIVKLHFRQRSPLSRNL